MTLPYLGRLLCLLSSAFFLTYAGASLLVWLFAKTAVRSSVSYQPATAARCLFALRLFPLTVATVLVTTLITPSYLRFEPRAGTEELSAFCLITCLCGVTTLGLGLWRGGAAIIRSRRYLRMQEESNAPLILLAGIFRPRLVVSAGIRDVLTEDEFAAALRHEDAHGRAKDNLKRLLILMSPNLFPFRRGLRAIESGWQRLAEWAADDFAAQGSTGDALALASALIRVGRLNIGAPALPLSTSLLADTADLCTRVERLVEARQDYRRLPSKSMLGIIALTLAIVVDISPNLLPSAHLFLEALAN